MVDRTPDKTWVVFFIRPQLEPQLVIAARVVVVGDHLIFTDSRGDMVGLFLLEVVESYSEVPS